jgi:hypothetical protein
MGSQILGEHCRNLDEHAWRLPGDRQSRERRYERFGYRVVAEAIVIGVPNWFMWRQKP